MNQTKININAKITNDTTFTIVKKIINNTKNSNNIKIIGYRK